MYALLIVRWGLACFRWACSCFVPVLARGAAVEFGETSVKLRERLESYQEGDFRDTGAWFEKFAFSPKNTGVVNIFGEGHAGSHFKLAAKMGFAHAGDPGHLR